jgi:hypothetical protein
VIDGLPNLLARPRAIGRRGGSGHPETFECRLYSVRTGIYLAAYGRDVEAARSLAEQVDDFGGQLVKRLVVGQRGCIAVRGHLGKYARCPVEP